MSSFSKRKDKASAFGKPGPSISPADTDRMSPVFSFEYMADRTGYSVECCDSENNAALAKKLYKLSKVTWMEIRNAHRHGMGTEKISRDAINPPLPFSLAEDATLLAMRYNGKAPIIGFRDGRVFYIIFIDHNFTVYDHS